jgi:hypothetical protein
MARRPFFGQNDTKIAKMDMQAATAPGRAYAAAFKGLGEDIGGAIEKYQLNKEKQKKNEGFIKSQSGMLDMLAEQDPEMASQYAAMKEQLNNPDVPLATRAEFGKNLVNNITLSTQLKGQRLLQDTQAQTLKEKKETEDLRKSLLQQKEKYNNLGIELQQLALTEDKELSAAKIKNTLAKYGLSDSQIEAEKEILPSKTAATISSNKATEMKGDIFVADAMKRGGPVGVAKDLEIDRDLAREDIRSAIRSRDMNSAAAIYKSMNIGGSVPQDLEKRFSDISSQISKIDDSQIKVRNTDGDEVMVTFKDYQDNPDNFAPLVSDRLKLLETKKNGLIEEQTNVMLDARIPYTDPETGEQKFTTVREKMAYDQIRAKKIQDQRQAKIEENKAKLPGAFYGMPSSPVMGY